MNPQLLQLIAAGGVLESGMIANMRTYRLPAWPRTHTRILGSDKTLCGRSLVHNDQWAWQFINRGHFNERLPSQGRDPCKTCMKHRFVIQTQKVMAAKAEWKGGSP